MDDGISCHVSFPFGWLVGWKWSHGLLDVDEPALALCTPVPFKCKQQTKWSRTLLLEGHRFIRHLVYTVRYFEVPITSLTLKVNCSVITTLVYNETNIQFLSWRYIRVILHFNRHICRFSALRYIQWVLHEGRSWRMGDLNIWEQEIRTVKYADDLVLLDRE